MNAAAERPEGLELVRTTAIFSETTVPAGLLRAHRIAAGVWGRLVVRSGSLVFQFEEGPKDPVTLREGQSQDIPRRVTGVFGR